MSKRSDPLSQAIPHDDAEDCVALWRAVLLQAFMDLLAPSFPRSNASLARTMRDQQVTAARWLRGRCFDFQQVCAFAAIDPDRVSLMTTRALFALAHNDPKEIRKLRRAATLMLDSHPARGSTLMNYGRE